ncbi:MAG: APC family permease, partial [Planctomycetota bacterium]
LIPLSFCAAFAIYFPAVTGIDAGVNMSGDLKDPARSIPTGTLLAVLVGLVVYLVQIMLGAGAFERADLVNRPFEILKDGAVFKLGFVVVGGAFAATLSSALGSLLGAPRVLQAVARDKIIGVLRPFAKGEGAGDEPRRAVVVTGIAGVIVLLWAGNSAGGGSLNAVASIITMFFLYSYGMINLAAFIEAASGNPSFRPRFRFFHWATALAGALGSVIVAFLINPVAAIAAAVLLGGLVVYVQTRDLQTSFGDARRGFVFRRARQNLIQLMAMEQDTKNWRPTILVFSGNPVSRDTLVTYAVWLESGRGFVFLAQVLVGSLAEHANHRRMAVKRLREFCEQNEVHAFPSVVVASQLEDGIATLLQTAGIAPVRTNLVMFGWSLERTRVLHTVKHLRTASTLDKSVILLHDRGLPPSPGANKRIDVWWRGQRNGALMLTLAHLLSKNWEWQGSRIRVIRVVRDEVGLEPAKIALQKLMEAARVNAEAFTLLADGGFAKTLHATSGDATCVLLGFETPSV